MPTVPRIHIEVPDDVHHRAKVAAVTRGISLKQYVIEALEQANKVAESGTDKRKRR